MTNDSKAIVKSETRVLTELDLTPSNTLDLSHLSDDQKKQLQNDYAKGKLKLALKAEELQIDSSALKKTLHDLSEETIKISQSGDAVTASHSKTTSLGRTEIIMGNTEQAQSGKLSKSQIGEKDWTPYYIFGGIIALIIIVSMMSK